MPEYKAQGTSPAADINTANSELWLSYTSGDGNIVYERYNGSWSPPYEIGSGVKGNNPSILLTSDGVVYIAYEVGADFLGRLVLGRQGQLPEEIVRK